MIRAVLDTNVVVSAYLEEQGPEALILSLALGRLFRCFVSEELFREYQEVLTRPKFDFDKERINKSLKEVRKGMKMVRPRRKLDVTRDRDDNMVLECALEARADYVVTGNFAPFSETVSRYSCGGAEAVSYSGGSGAGAIVGVFPFNRKTKGRTRTL